MTARTLKFPETAITSLVKESKYLYENTIFEIVAHALNLHRDGIKSDAKPKMVVKKSKTDLNADVRDLYVTKVKNIYGEIIRYATTAQSSLDLTKLQNKRVSEVKIANRRMVEIIKDVKEIGSNVSIFMNSDNEYIRNEYDVFRKKVVKVLRVIYLFRKEQDNSKHYNKLVKLKREAKENVHLGSRRIDNLIRKDLITAEMASSLVNDNDNVNHMIRNLIEVAELLYGKEDTILENGDK